MKTVKLVIAAAVMIASMMPAKAQKWGKTPEDSAKCVLNFSLYRESYKAKAYVEAYDAWKECVTNCPKCSENLYINGTTILKAKMQAAAPADRPALVEELMALYDKRVENFGKPEVNLPKKAYELEKLLGRKGVDRYYPLYADAIRIGGDKVDAEYVYLYFVATVDYVEGGYAEPTLVIDNYDIASTLLEKELKENFEDSAAAGKIREFVASVETKFSPYADCGQLVNIYSKKFEAEPDNVELLQKITNIMDKKGCTKEELYFKATERLYALAPSASTALKVGQMCYSKAKYGDAVKYLKDAIDSLSDQDLLYKAYLLMGLSYGEQRSWSAARSAFYKAAELDPTKGDPYLQIASLYAESYRSIDDGMGGHSAFWAACDKANRAKSIDPACADMANKMINAYAGSFPKQVDAFMLNVIDGTSFYVPGWIGESTTVRTRK